ncbi:MAG: permease [Rhodomicrobium sp.]|nr:permease [Rhodomicrobium sp.]
MSKIAAIDTFNVTGRIVIAVLILWGLTVAVLAQSGVIARIFPPLIALIVAAGIVLPVAAYTLIPPFRRYIEHLGLRTLTLFHIWRIPAALLFFWYGAHDLLPETFVRNAAWGDLIAGSIALVIAFLPERRSQYIFFHLFGFADFVLAVGTGLTFTLLLDPRMAAITTLPMALIPFYGVGISGASHLMAFHLLWTKPPSRPR